MAKVAFISHASEDAAIAATITDYLENNGVHAGSRRATLLLAASTRRKSWTGSSSSAVFVLVLSENANKSIFVKREVERAVSKGKPVFPIRVRQVMPSRSLELFISSAHWIDAWKPPMEKYLERLAQSISAAAAVYPAERTGIRYAEGEWFLAGGKDQGPCRRDCCRELSSAPRLRWLVCVQIDRYIGLAPSPAEFRATNKA